MSSSKKRNSHARTVTRFCDEANIAEGDQLDLAEFIVAARYLGAEANNDQLMNVFTEMEDDNAAQKKPKEVLKDLMKMVDNKYGTDLQGLDDKKTSEPTGDDVDDKDEILQANPLDAFSEDAIWQQDQMDDLFTATEQDQNLKIARNLLATTALTRHEIAEITGVSADDLKDYESDEYETESDDEEELEVPKSTKKTVGFSEPTKEKKTIKFSEAAKENKEAAVKNEGGVAIVSKEYSKSVMLDKDELELLNLIIAGGAGKVAEKSEDSLKLLTKLSAAVNLSPGQKKRNKTIVKINLANLHKNDEAKEPKKVKLPAKYRVIMHPGALCKKEKELASEEVSKLPIGTVVVVEEIDGRRARISSPNPGWCSIRASDKRIILQRSNVKSAAMDKAIHAQRARQTKVLILKSITTLNDATVTRILEKSDWNLRRAIEAFYIAKYKTQEYLNKKGAPKSNAKSNTSGNDNKKNKKRQSQKWWKSWKSFANER